MKNATYFNKLVLLKEVANKAENFDEAVSMLANHPISTSYLDNEFFKNY